VRIASISGSGGALRSTKDSALMVSTRYWRAQDIVPRTVEGDTNYETAGLQRSRIRPGFRGRRGTGASFGSRTYEMTVDESRITVRSPTGSRPAWSNHKIGSFGVSYVGNTAEMLLVNRNPVVAAAARSSTTSTISIISPIRAGSS